MLQRRLFATNVVPWVVDWMVLILQMHYLHDKNVIVVRLDLKFFSHGQ
jgi:hypothetical protein